MQTNKLKMLMRFQEFGKSRKVLRLNDIGNDAKFGRTTESRPVCVGP